MCNITQLISLKVLQAVIELWSDIQSEFSPVLQIWTCFVWTWLLELQQHLHKLPTHLLWRSWLAIQSVVEAPQTILDNCLNCHRSPDQYYFYSYFSTIGVVKYFCFRLYHYIGADHASSPAWSVIRKWSPIGIESSNSNFENLNCHIEIQAQVAPCYHMPETASASLQALYRK